MTRKNRVYSNITVYIIARICRYLWKGTCYTKELKHLSNTSNSAAFAVLKRLKTFVENKESKIADASCKTFADVLPRTRMM